jgi:hypothetical protein
MHESLPGRSLGLVISAVMDRGAGWCDIYCGLISLIILGRVLLLFIYFYDIKIRNSMIEQFSNENGSPIESKM